MLLKIIVCISLLIVAVNSKPADYSDAKSTEKGLVTSAGPYLPPSHESGHDKTNLILAKIGHVFAQPPSQLEYAILEEESLPSKKDSLYTNLQEHVANFLQPKPIVDTIQEHEKYGNTGDQFYSVGRVVVNKVEDVANWINAAVEIPGKAFYAIVGAVSEKLNHLGGKIVGLAK